MVFNKKEWIGCWDNFENYIYSDNRYMKKCWEEVETVCKQNPGFQKMFPNGVKEFWKKACNTITEENPVRLGGWKIGETQAGMQIEWMDQAGTILGCYEYELIQLLERGLEGKENYIFKAVHCSETCPFAYFLAMEPMPERAAIEKGGLLSHLHFQYASHLEKLVQNNRLCNSFWYATMCAGNSTVLEQCNIVRALHRMPVWKSLE